MSLTLKKTRLKFFLNSSNVSKESLRTLFKSGDLEIHIQRIILKLRIFIEREYVRWKVLLIINHFARKIGGLMKRPVHNVGHFEKSNVKWTVLVKSWRFKRFERDGPKDWTNQKALTVCESGRFWNQKADGARHGGG